MKYLARMIRNLTFIINAIISIKVKNKFFLGKYWWTGVLEYEKTIALWIQILRKMNLQLKVMARYAWNPHSSLGMIKLMILACNKSSELKENGKKQRVKENYQSRKSNRNHWIERLKSNKFLQLLLGNFHRKSVGRKNKKILVSKLVKIWWKKILLPKWREK